MTAITEASILIVATHGFEQSELEVPRDRLREAGANVVVAAPEPGAIKGWQKRDWGRLAPVDLTLDEVSVDDFDALVLPGGQMNPDTLRRNETAVALIRAFADAGRTVAAICHAPWLLIEAELVEGRTMTSWQTLRKDLRNAGANWVDEDTVVDGTLITSRSPKDLDAFVAAIIQAVEESPERESAAAARDDVEDDRSLWQS